MGGACSRYEGEEKCVQELSGETRGEETTWKEDNIKMDLQEVGCGPWIGLIWLGIGIGGGHL